MDHLDSRSKSRRKPSASSGQLAISNTSSQPISGSQSSSRHPSYVADYNRFIEGEGTFRGMPMYESDKPRQDAHQEEEEEGIFSANYYEQDFMHEYEEWPQPSTEWPQSIEKEHPIPSTTLKRTYRPHVNDYLPATHARLDTASPSFEEEENSPIEIVAKTVSTFDDPSLPCLTFRFWILGTLFTVLGSAISQFYYFRANYLVFSIFFVQLLSYPLGMGMARFLPKRDFHLFGGKFSLNPGPFNVKEHLLIGIAVTSGGTAAYAADILAVSELFFRYKVPVAGALTLLITTQCIGYGLAGFLKRFLVEPSSMIWPSNLVQVALYNTLHGSEPQQTGMRRLTFFVIAFFGILIYQLMPGYMMPILGYLSVVCWIAPKSGVAQLLGSARHGLGMGAISLDWSSIGTFGPLVTPWWAQVNFYVGLILMVWVVAPLLWWFNVWDAWKFDLVTADQYDLEGDLYDIPRVLTSEFSIDVPAMQAYSPLRMSPLFAASYGTSFLMLSATVTHVFLYYRHNIARQFKASRSEKDDIHTKLMRAYPQVPYLWYACMFLTMVILAIITCEVYFGLKWWGLLLAVATASVLTLPIGIIQAISNNQIPLNVLSELVIGYIYPGHPIANVAFKAYGYMTMYQCLLLVSDMKLGHYMKIPPRKLFTVQLYGTLVGVAVNYGVMEWILSLKADVFRGLESDPTGQWQARNSRIFYSASIIWGAFGPARVFGGESPYAPLLWFFLIGLVLPIPFYLLYKKYPNGIWHLINIPIMCIGSYTVPTLPANFITSGFLVSFLFQFYIYRFKRQWWNRFNYVLSAALDAGTQISAMLVFLLLGQSDLTAFPYWWGNPDPSQHAVDYCNVTLARGGPHQ